MNYLCFVPFSVIGEDEDYIYSGVVTNIDDEPLSEIEVFFINLDTEEDFSVETDEYG